MSVFSAAGLAAQNINYNKQNFSAARPLLPNATGETLPREARPGRQAFAPLVNKDTAAPPIAPNANQTPQTAEDDGFGFDDLLDIINPLQHIPIISHIYQEITGDKMGPMAEIIGGGLFGGIVGLAGSVVNVIVEEQTGDDITGHVMTALLGNEENTPASGAVAATQLVQNDESVDEAPLIAEAADEIGPRAPQILGDDLPLALLVTPPLGAPYSSTANRGANMAQRLSDQNLAQLAGLPWHEAAATASKQDAQSLR